MTDSPDHIKSNRKYLAWLRSATTQENDTHGHSSCLENRFVVFDGVDELICSTLSFVRSLNMEPHPRTFPERSNSLWRGQCTPPNLIHPSGQEQLGDSSPESAFDAGSVLNIQPYAMKQFLSVYITEYSPESLGDLIRKRRHTTRLRRLHGGSSPHSTVAIDAKGYSCPSVLSKFGV